MYKADVVVIGAGASGLSAAYHIAKTTGGKAVIYVLEHKDKPAKKYLHQATEDVILQMMLLIKKAFADIIPALHIIWLKNMIRNGLFHFSGNWELYIHVLTVIIIRIHFRRQQSAVHLYQR